LNIH
jgi:WD40 repeat protein